MNQLKHNLRAKEHEINEVINSLHRVREELQQMSLLNKSINESLQQSRTTISSKEARIQDLEHRLSLMENQKKLDDLSVQNNMTAWAETKKMLERERDEIKLRLETQTLDMQEKDAQIANLKLSLSESNSEKANAQQENKKIKLELQKLLESHYQLENNLKESLNSTESNNQLIEKTLTALQQDKASLEKELAATNENFNQLVKELNETKARLNSVSEDLDSKKNKLYEQESLLAARSEEINELQARMREDNAEQSCIQQSLYRAELEKEELKFSLTKLQNELHKTDADHEEKLSELRTEVNRLKHDLSAREGELALKNKEIEGYLDNYDNLSSELNTLKIQHENTIMALKETEEINSQNLKNLSRVEEDLTKAKSLNTSWMNQITTLKTTNFILNNNIESLKAEKKILSDKLKELEQNIKGTEALLLRKDNEIETLKTNIEALQIKLQDNLDAREAAEQDLEDCKLQIDQLRKINSELEKTNQQLSDKFSLELSEQKKYYQNKLQEVPQADATEIRKLNNQIEVYEIQLKNLTQTLENKCTEYEKKLSYQEAKYKALEKYNTQSTNSSREIPQELQKWRDFASFLNEKALMFLAYMGVPESDVIFSPVPQTDEFKTITEEAKKRLALVEENLSQYSFALENAQKAVAENEDLKAMLAAKETDYKDMLKQIEQMKTQGSKPVPPKKLASFRSMARAENFY